jgi:hypothetical protein
MNISKTVLLLGALSIFATGWLYHDGYNVRLANQARGEGFSACLELLSRDDDNRENSLHDDEIEHTDPSDVIDLKNPLDLNLKKNSW